MRFMLDVHRWGSSSSRTCTSRAYFVMSQTVLLRTGRPAAMLRRTSSCRYMVESMAWRTADFFLVLNISFACLHVRFYFLLFIPHFCFQEGQVRAASTKCKVCLQHS